MTVKGLLSAFGTFELVEELAERTGVQKIVIPNPDISYQIIYKAETDDLRYEYIAKSGTGPKKILIITD